MPLAYGWFSFLGYRWFRHFIYFELIETAFEGITLAAFLLLIVEFVSSSSTNGDIKESMAQKEKIGLPMTVGQNSLTMNPETTQSSPFFSFFLLPSSASSGSEHLSLTFCMLSSGRFCESRSRLKTFVEERRGLNCRASLPSKSVRVLSTFTVHRQHHLRSLR